MIAVTRKAGGGQAAAPIRRCGTTMVWLRRLYEVGLAGLVLGAGLLLWALFGDLFRDLLAMTRWERVPCRLGELWVGQPQDRPWHEVVRGSIHYEYGGAAYHSSRLALEELRFLERGYAAPFIDALEARSDPQCLVDPRDPRRAVLMIGSSRVQTVVYWVGLGFSAAFVVLGALLLWRVITDPDDLRDTVTR